MRTLLVDNHDSYTFNLFQLIAEVNGAEPEVVVNDDPALKALRRGAFDNVVISPGPGGPACPRDIGYLADLLRSCELPVLGVCLGHQAIAWAAGARIGPAPRARHGYLSLIKHDEDELFAGIPDEFVAVRYHSLCVAEPLPEVLTAIARAEDGVLMAVRHRELPRWGVQFHPESIASEHGRELLANFRDLTPVAHRSGRARPPGEPRLVSRARPPGEPRLVSRAVDTAAADAETIFAEFFGSSASCFWLDSSLARPGESRFSFLGDGSGPLSETLSYRVGTGRVSIQDAQGAREEPGTVFEVLERRLGRLRLADPDLPFDFTCGYVGYFGYETRADCGGAAVRVSPAPDAVWMLADRLIAIDHEAGICYLLALHDGSDGLRAAAAEWMDRIAARLTELGPLEPLEPAEPVDPDAFLVRGRDDYQADIRECQRQLIEGESYEINLTNRLHLPFRDTDLAFCRRLRRANPAPFAAFLRLADVSVFSSSPERFLRIERDGQVESKPIKGTAPRHADPVKDARIAGELAASPKNRAENLMIVDLLRNDLGRVCEIGSVTVGQFAAVESYATVHHLVSAIRGRLKPEISAVECVRRCFPAGSMTGAPKLRTMEIIDRLETEARGVYSGALGYFGLSGGVDLNVVIRTAVRHGGTLTVGSGGAIVLDSSPEEEYEEMLLKATATLRAYRR